MSLLKTIKEQLKSPMQAAPTAGTQTQTVRDLMRAKSGKQAQPSAAPKQSNIQEKMAEQQTQQAGQQQQQAGEIQAAQIGEREADIGQRSIIQEQQYQDNLKNIQASFDQRSNSILNQFESGQMRLDNSRDIQALEQLGVEARLQNKQYIDQLQSEGSKKRLNNQLEFKREMAKTLLQDNQDILKNDLAFKTIVDANDREFQREIADIDINFAMQMADSAAKAASTQQIAAGVGSVVSSGIEGAVKSGAFKSKKGDANIDN